MDGALQRLALELRADERRERLARLMVEYRALSDDALGFMWYSTPGHRGVIECVRWERAIARGVVS